MSAICSVPLAQVSGIAGHGQALTHAHQQLTAFCLAIRDGCRW